MEKQNYVYTVQFIGMKDGQGFASVFTGDRDFLQRLCDQLKNEYESVVALYVNTVHVGLTQPFVIKSKQEDVK